MLGKIDSEKFVLEEIASANFVLSKDRDVELTQGAKGLSESVIARLWDQISSAIFERSIVLFETLRSERGDVPGWVLVVLMTTGLVTGIWTLAAPRIDSILRNSLDSMNGIR